MTETFYDLLGVPEDASVSEIEDAYRENIKQVHPDVSDDVNAAEHTKRLNEAKRVLTDETKRERYDRLGHDGYTNETYGTDDRDTTPGKDSGDREGHTRQSNDATGGTRGRSSGRRRRGGGSRESSNGRDDRTDSGRSTNDGPSGESSGSDAWWTGDGTSGGESTDGSGRSRSSTGPSWQSSRTGTTASTAGTATESPSAQRQAAAGNTDGPNVDWSWNGWDRTRSWAVREGESGNTGLHPVDLFPADQSVLLLASTFLLYPFFIITVLYPPFPLVARAAVGVCTLLMFAYLLSVPRVAVFVYGVWSVLVPVFISLVPGVSIFSLVGVIGLTATWIPLGLSMLTLSVLQP
ncbi:hypothetical protein BRC64_10955 [Halobacteriales archaeon QH_10_67_22]|nr:MAG: hypothetical protein BRC64_10955 [Halobacteriales archaeon QH_10_67_22]